MTLDILIETKLCESKGEAKRLIQQGGVSVNDVVIKDLSTTYSSEDLKQGLKIRKGKKVFHKAILD